MIVLREINIDEYMKVNPILKEEGIEDDLSKGIVYILIDNDDIIGVGKIKLENEYGILEYIIVKAGHRGSNLGDSILRSLLFKAETMKIKEVYYRDNEEYLLSRGFEYNNNKFKDFYKLYLKIDDFFKKKSCGDKDEL